MDNKKLTILSIVIFTLSLLVFITTVFLVFYKPSIDANKEKKQKKVKTVNVEIGDISTQIGSSGKYYKGFIVLEVTGKKTPAKLEDKMPQVKDSIISAISYSKPSDITSEKGMKDLKEKIKNNVNEIIGSEDVVQVLFTTSILQ